MFSFRKYSLQLLNFVLEFSCVIFEVKLPEICYQQDAGGWWVQWSSKNIWGLALFFPPSRHLLLAFEYILADRNGGCIQPGDLEPASRSMITLRWDNAPWVSLQALPFPLPCFFSVCVLSTCNAASRLPHRAQGYKMHLGGDCWSKVFKQTFARQISLFWSRISLLQRALQCFQIWDPFCFGLFPCLHFGNSPSLTSLVHKPFFSALLLTKHMSIFLSHCQFGGWVNSMLH